MQVNSNIRAGLVGTGYICEYHVAALRRIPGVELVGVFDVDPAKAAEAARTHGTKSFESLAAMRAAGVDVVHVLTPPHTHAAVALEALELGCHVLVEKPLAVDVEDCERIRSKAELAGRQVCVNHSLLFDPQIRKALRTVRSGKLGRVVSVDILRSSVYPPYAGGTLPPQYRTAGYPFRDLGVHALYLFEAFLGPIEQVTPSWASLGGDPNLAYDEWRAQVRCRDGMGQIQLSWNVKPLQSQIIVQGTKGVMRVDLFLMFQALRRAAPVPKPAERVLNALTDSVKPLIDVPIGVLKFLLKRVRPYHGLQDLVAAFYASLASGSAPPVGVADAERVVQWTEAVARAADDDHRRRVEPLEQTLSERVPYLVTGASGGLGSEIVRRLLEQGARVRIMARRPPADMAERVEVVLGDLGNPEAVDRAVRGANVVIHAGAAMKGGWPEHQCGTVTGTRNVLESALRHGVRKVVHVSSMSVVDWAGGERGSVLSEESPLEPRPLDRGHYTRAKLEAERLVVEYTKERGLPSVILRPGQIFGRRIPLLTPAVARRIGNRWLILGAGDLPLPLVHIDDVVDAILNAAAGDLHGAEVIQIVGSQTLTQREVLAHAVGPGARTVRIPRWILPPLGAASQVILGALRRKSPVSPYRLRSALSYHRFESTRAGLLKGWSPRVTLQDGILQEVKRADGGSYNPAVTSASVARAAEPTPT